MRTANGISTGVSLLLVVVLASNSSIARAQLPVELPNGSQGLSGHPTLSLASTRKQFSVGDPIMVMLTLKNSSNSSVSLSSLLSPEEDYEIQVEDHLRQRVAASEGSRRSNLRVVSAAVIELKPGSARNMHLDLKELFDLTIPGVYYVRAERLPLPISKPQRVASDWVPITIVARGAETVEERIPSRVFQIYCQAVQGVVKVNNPVHLAVTLTNISSNTASVDESGIDGGYDFEVRDEQAHSIALTAYGAELRTLTTNQFERRSFDLKPGEKLITPIDLGRRFDLMRPGIYVIKASRTFPAGSGAEREEAESNRVRIQVIE